MSAAHHLRPVALNGTLIPTRQQRPLQQPLMTLLFCRTMRHLSTPMVGPRAEKLSASVREALSVPIGSVTLRPEHPIPHAVSSATAGLVVSSMTLQLPKATCFRSPHPAGPMWAFSAGRETRGIFFACWDSFQRLSPIVAVTGALPRVLASIIM